MINENLISAYRFRRYLSCGDHYPKRGPNPAHEAMRAAKSVSAYVIFKGARHVATVQVFHGNACVVNVWQESEAYIKSAKARGQFTDDTAAFHHFQFQRGVATGYGYDKFTAALSGLIIDGHELTGHCSRFKSPKKPDGLPCYPSGFQVPAGYSAANHGYFSKESGNRLTAYDWRERAFEALGKPDANVESNWEAIATKAHEMEIEWQASDDCVSGFSDCYREAGLEYLKKRGYRVISAL